MNSEIRARRNRFWALLLVFVMVVGMLPGTGVQAETYLIDGPTDGATNPGYHDPTSLTTEFFNAGDIIGLKLEHSGSGERIKVNYYDIDAVNSGEGSHHIVDEITSNSGGITSSSGEEYYSTIVRSYPTGWGTLSGEQISNRWKLTKVYTSGGAVEDPNETEYNLGYYKLNLRALPKYTIIWEPNGGKLIVDGNEHEISEVYPYFIEGDPEIVLPTAENFKKTGHTLDEWVFGFYDDETGKYFYTNDFPMPEGATSISGGNVRIFDISNWPEGEFDDYVIRLGALWTPNSYQVSYNPNLPSGESAVSGNMANQDFTYGESGNLTLNAYSIPGYSFEKWASSGAGEATTYYTDGQEVINLTSASGAIVELNACWKGNDYKVVFHRNYDAASGTSTVEQDFVYGTAGDLTFNQWSRNGYSFGGWASASGSTTVAFTDGQNVNKLTKVQNGTIDLYAIWEPGTYTAKFETKVPEGENPNNAIPVTLAPIYAAYEDTATLSGSVTMPGEPSASGTTINHYHYTFDGWRIDKDITPAPAVHGTGTAVSVPDLLTEMGAGSGETTIPMIGRWSPVDYSFGFNAGLAGIANPDSVIVAYNSYIDLPALIDNTSSYVFLGWKFLDTSDVGNTIDEEIIPAADQVSVKDLVTISENQCATVGISPSENMIWGSGATALTLTGTWTSNKYTINYNVNTTGGSGAPVPSPATVTSDSGMKCGVDYVTPALLSDTSGNYDFLGWSLNQNATTAAYRADTLVGVNTLVSDVGTDIPEVDGVKSITLYGVWRAKNTLTYDANGATTGSAPNPVKYSAGSGVDIAGRGDLAKTGHSFKEWNTQSDGSGTPYAENTANAILTSPETVLYAIWIPNTYDVVLDVKAPSGVTPTNVPSANQNSLAYGTGTILLGSSGNKPSDPKNDYIFLGWTTDPTNSTSGEYTGTSVTVQTIIDSGYNPLNPGSTTGNKVIKLYGVWQQRTQYNLSFDDNGSTSGSAPATITKTENKTADMPGQGSLVKTGYVFGGWKDDANKVYSENEEYTFTKSETLKAVWIPITYTVIYNPNTTEITVPSYSQVFTYDVFDKIMDYGFEDRLGYTPLGWSRNQNATEDEGIEYSSGFEIGNNITSVSGEEINLYVVWRVDDYFIDYDLNNPSDMVTPTPSISGEDAYEIISYESDLSLPSPSPSATVDYTFKGWSLDKGAGATVLFTSASADKSVKTLVAAAIAAEEVPGTTVITYGDYPEITLYGVWEKNSYDVTFDMQGHGTAPAGQSILYGGLVNKPAADPSVTGYIFGGWYKEQDCNNSWTFTSDTVTGLTTIYAKWTPITYKVHFDNNAATGISGEMTDQPFTYDVAQNLKSNAYTRTGYIFLGWATSASGEVSYTNGQNVINLKSVSGETLPLYAVWDAKDYLVTFNKNVDDGSVSGEMTPQGFKYDTAQKLKENAYTRKGYTFKGWATSETGAVTYTDKQNVTNLKSGSGETLPLYAVWEANAYSVEFDKNVKDSSVSGTMTPQNFKYGTAQDLTKNKYTRIGYTFLGWATSESGEVTYTDGQNVKNLKSVSGETLTLYASWDANDYKVTFDKNVTDSSVSGTMTPQNFEYGTAQNLTKNKYTRKGYTFKGWATSTSGPVAYTDGQNVTNLKSGSGETLPLYAVWEANAYSVKFDKNVKDSSVSGTMTPQNFKYGTAQDLNANEYTRKGYTFLGWATSESGEVTYTDRQNVKNLKSVSGETLTLYASWDANDYKVTFDKNVTDSSVSGTMTPQNFEYGTAQNLTKNKYTRKGYTFKGWATSTSGPVTYTDEQNVTNLKSGSGETLPLYAVWEANDYSVEFDKNVTDSSVSGEMLPQNFKYDTAQNLNANAYSRTGYTFSGWAISATGVLTYADGANVNNLESVSGETVTLYALWDANEYSVSFDKNVTDGSVSGEMTPQSFEYGTAQNLDANAYTREGYTFKGWATSATGPVTYTDKQNVINLKSGSEETLPLYAVWEANAYSVEFDKNVTDSSVSGTMTAQNFKYGTAQDLKENVYTRTGYTFSGWATSATGVLTYADGANVNNLESVSGETVTLYALWDANEYTVSFDENVTDDSVSGEMLPQNFEYGTAQNLRENVYTRTGYTFEGWATSASGEVTYGDKASVDKLTTTAGATVTLYAKWTANSYKVQFDKNDEKATGTMADQTFTYDADAAALTKNAFTKTGYTFAGWKDEDSNKTYTDEQLVQNLASAKDAVITLKAQWTVNSYNVRFNKNSEDAAGTMADQVFVYDSAKTALRQNIFTRTGYKFNGWKDAEGTAYTDKQKIQNLTPVNNKVVNLYAQWKANKFTVLFDPDADDAEGTMANQVFTYDIAQNLRKNAYTRPGYTFIGWEDADENTYADQASVQNLTSDDAAYINLVALWQANTYKVQFDKNAEDASGTMADQSFTYGANKEALTVNAFTRTGYIFSGWKDDAGNSYADQAEVKNLTTDNNGTVVLKAQWTPISYTVKFDKNDEEAEGTTADQNFTYDVAQNLTANGYSKTGYHFAGWAAAADGDVVYADCKNVNNLAAADGAVVTLYAVWTNNSYTVRFNKNAEDASGSTNDQEFTFGTAKNLTLNGYSRDGYTFEGWATAANGAVVYADGESVVNLSSDAGAIVDLYAVWTANGYSVRFNKNADDAAGTAENQVFVYAVAQKLNANTFSRTGYVFDGWALSEDGAAAYADGASVNNLSTADGAIVDIYAVWKPIKYSVMFNVNAYDVTGSMDDQAFTYGTAQNLTMNAYTKAGYKFAGWALSENGAAAYTDGQSVSNLTSTADETVILYAKWAPVTYSVHFDKNSAEATGTMTDQELTYDSVQSLTTAGFSRSGYTFGGWALTASSAAEYANSAYVVNLADAQDAVVTLYAVWNSTTPAPQPMPPVPPPTPTDDPVTIEYKITYMVNGTADTKTGNPAKYTYGVGTKITEKVELVGFKFTGWYSQAKDGFEVTEISKTTSGDITLYARFEEEDKLEYNITYMVDGKEDLNTGNPDTYVVGVGAKIEYPVSKEGYDFIGWFTSYNGGSRITEIPKDAKGDKVVYARFEEKKVNKYNITYIVDGEADETTGNPSYYYEGEGASISYGAKKKYHSFMGWFDSESEGNRVSEISKDSKEDITLYAHFEPLEFAIEYYVDGKLVNKKPSTYVYGKGAKITAKASKKNYNFEGWYTAEEDGEKVTEISKNSKDTVKLYARFTPKSYKITYYNDKGKKTESYGNPTSYKYGEGAKITNPAVKKNYLFVGWYNMATSKKVTSISAKSTGDIRLYAKFKKKTPNKYKITYIVDGKEDVSTGNPATYVKGKGTEAFKRVSKTGYKFLGWYTDAETGKKLKNISKKRTGDITLYARFEIKTFNITYMVDGVKNTETGNPSTYTVEDEVTISNGVTKEGYKFVGWFTKKKGGSQVTVIAKGSTGSKTLYARFEQKKELKSKFGELFARLVNYQPTAMTVEWNKLDNVDGYDVFGSQCNCGDEIRHYQYIKTLGPNETNLPCENLMKHTYYKFFIKAFVYDAAGNKEYVSKSELIHGTTTDSYFGVADKITVNKMSIRLRVGDTFTLVAKESNSEGKVIAAHRPINFESSAKKIASVGSTSGVVTAHKPGTCTIWIFAQNGIYTQCEVTVLDK